jgi:predicted nucleic acid-binding protein
LRGKWDSILLLFRTANQHAANAARVDRVFLDANVLFSAAYRPGAGLTRLWKLKGLKLISSEYAAQEARLNLSEEAQRKRLDEFLSSMDVVATPPSRPLPRGIALPNKDAPIFLAALEAQASHLLNGDKRHFGKYFGRKVGGILILPPAEYLQSG